MLSVRVIPCLVLMSEVVPIGAGLVVLDEHNYESQVECLFFYNRENCSKAQLPCRAMSGNVEQ